RSESELISETGEVKRDTESQGNGTGSAPIEPSYVGRGGVARPINPAVKEFRKNLREKLALLKMDDTFATRYVNDGFSGGEKKRPEGLQMAQLKPQIAMVDEAGPGLDNGRVGVVGDGWTRLKGPEMGVLLVTHYQRILNFVKPDFVHVMIDGKIVQSGGPELAHELEAKGYDWLRTDLGLPPAEDGEGDGEGDGHDDI